MSNPLSSYVDLARIVFSESKNEVWDEFEEFEEKLREFYESLLCKNCKNLIIEPCSPKKISKNQHFSCNHRVCLDCIGKNRTTTLNCKLCRDFTLFEKSSQTKIVLKLFKEMCELIKTCWIYDYIQNHDTGQENSISLTELIENGINYGRTSSNNIVSIPDDSMSTESSDDENSNSSLIKPINIKNEEKSPQSVPYQQQTFPTISPLPPYSSPNPAVLQSPEPFALQEVVPSIQTLPTPQVMPTLAPNNKINTISTPPPPISPLLKASPFMSHAPMRVKSIMSPMKIQQQQAAPKIYSVMYTGSGKITLKRKAPDDDNSNIPITTDLSSTSNNTPTFVKTENFKAPPVQIISTQAQQIPIVVSNLTTLTTQSSSSSLNLNINLNEPQKRKGCRCGNATVAPGKLTCCGQRCPCYVDSKACIDCKCKGCRNPHYVDGHKKMRHQVPDIQTQQFQQQTFLQTIQAQAAMFKETQQKSSAMGTTTMIKTENMNLNEPGIIAKSQNSINNCIISMNSNGQYQIKPRIIMKEPVKASMSTMSPLIFPTTSTTGQIGNSNSSIQIVGLYSQVRNDKKIIIKNEIQTTGSVVSFTTDPTKQHLLDSSAQYTTNNLNTNML